VKRAEIIRDKGTNRKSFFRGEVDKYSWVDLGFSYLLCEFSAAYLLSHLESLEEITCNRIQIWNYYHEALKEFESKVLLAAGCLRSKTHICPLSHWEGLFSPNALSEMPILRNSSRCFPKYSSKLYRRKPLFSKKRLLTSAESAVWLP